MKKSEFDCFVSLTAICSVIFFAPEITAWFMQEVGTNKIPMYVYLYPVLAATIAVGGAFYAGNKAYQAALMTDIRERNFRDDELERKRLTYSCDLYYELAELVVDCKFMEEKCLLVKGAIDRNTLKFLDVSSDWFICDPSSLKADWNIQSCLEKDSLKYLFDIKASRELILKTTHVLHGFINTARKYEENKYTAPKDSAERMFACLDRLKVTGSDLEKKVDTFRVYLEKKYNIISTPS
jgi:hypothetical protein